MRQHLIPSPACVIALLIVITGSAADFSDADSDAKAMFAESGVSAGLFVYFRAGDGSLTMALRQNYRIIQVHGQSFARAPAGYYQAGRFAPSGRILVCGDGYVYSYGRKPEYLRSTTTPEHQLFVAPQEAPEIPERLLQAGSGGSRPQFVSFGRTPSLNPTDQPLAVEARITSTRPRGTIIACGGATEGFALTLAGGQPQFHIRAKDKLTTISGEKRIGVGWHHVAGVLTKNRQMRLYVDGKRVTNGKATRLLANDPVQGLEVGGDDQSVVGDYVSPNAFGGVIDEVRLYFVSVMDVQIAARLRDSSELFGDPVLAVSFDDGTARDLSPHQNNGTLNGSRPTQGKFARHGNSLVQPKWTAEVPICVRAMVAAGQTLFIAGPPDIIDEESTFWKLTEKDPKAQKLLAKQDVALNETFGGSLLAVDTRTGRIVNAIELDTLSGWNGVAGANGRLFPSTLDG